MGKLLNKINLSLLLILILGAVFRLLCLNKVDGLWYDELISYNQSSQSTILAVIKTTLNADYHFPLYQVFLHFWGHLFSFSDLSMRLFSAFFGVLTVIISFFLGKELKSEKVGLFCAGIFSINSFLIYYSQEVRMYSLLTFLSCLFLLFLLKIKNDYKNNWNYVGLILSSYALIFAYTISIAFVIPQVFLLMSYLIIINKNNKFFLYKKSAICAISLLIICIPLFTILYFLHVKSFGAAGVSPWNLSYFIIVLQNWFSPIINTIVPIDYAKKLFNSITFHNSIFIFIPIMLGLSSIIYALKKDKFSSILLSGALIFIILQIIAINSTPFPIQPRYTLVIFPSILILISYGFSLIENNKLKILLTSLFIVINLSYLVVSQNAAFKISHGGYKPLTDIVNQYAHKDDFVVVWNRTEILNKYISIRLNTLSLLKNFAYTSDMILNNEKVLNKKTIKDRKTILRNYFLDKHIPQNNILIMYEIYKHMTPGQKFILTTTTNFDKYTPDSFAKVVNDDKKYSLISYNDLMTVKALLDLKMLSCEFFHFVKRKQNKNFVVYVFEKR